LTPQEILQDEDNAQAWAHELELNNRHQEETKMANFIQKDNEIALFREEEKKSDKSPDMTGKGLVGGTEYRVAAWKNTSQAGKTYLKLSFSIPGDFAKRSAEVEVDDLPF